MASTKLRTSGTSMRASIARIASARQAEAGASELTFEQLTEVVKSAATIGVSPEAWRPIGWMNEAHYGELLKNNVLAGRLTQQIEAYKVVAAQGP